MCQTCSDVFVAVSGKALRHELPEACTRLHGKERQVAACSPSCAHQTHTLTLQFSLSENYFCRKSMIHSFKIYKIEIFQQVLKKKVVLKSRTK